MPEHATIKDVAARAGVALSTASNVLNNTSKSVRAETRARIWAAARDLDYRPNLAARSLATRRSRTVALWISDVGSAFSGRIISHLQREARRDGFDVLIWGIPRSGEAPLPGWPDSGPGLRLPHGQVDGIAAFLGSERRDVHLEALASARVPAVIMGAFPMESADFVGVDLASGATAAVCHLLAAGCRRVGFLVPAEADFAGDPRREAYVMAAQSAGQEPLFLRSAENSRRAARAVVTDFFSAGGVCDGLFCYNDEAALGAYRGLRDRNLRVPDDVSLVGCDDILDSEYLDCPLTTLTIPVEALCAETWRFLESRMAAPAQPPRRALLPAYLTVRQSVRPLLLPRP